MVCESLKCVTDLGSKSLEKNIVFCRKNGHLWEKANIFLKEKKYR